MSNVTHVYFGNANHHPIISTYLNFFPCHKLVHCSKGNSRFRRIMSLFRAIWKSKDSDAWYQCHDPVSLVVVILIKGRKRTIFDAHEVYSSYVKNRFANATAFYIETILFKLSKKIVFPSEPRKDIFFKGKDNSNIFIIENLVNDFELQVIENERLHFFSNVSDDSIIELLYAGTFTDVRAIKEIVESVNLVNETGVKTRLHLFGSSNPWLESIILGTENIIFHGRVERSVLINNFQNFDASFALYKPTDLNNTFCAPTKIFENECYSLPTICNSSIYVDKLVEDERLDNCIVINNYTPLSIKNAIEKISKKQKNVSSSQVSKEKATDNRLIWSAQLDIITRLYSE